LWKFGRESSTVSGICSHHYLITVSRTKSDEVMIKCYNKLYLFLKGYTLDGSGFSSQQRQEKFLGSKTFKPTLWPTQPLITWELGVLCPGVRHSGHEVDHSLPSSALITCKESMLPVPVSLLTCPVKYLFMSVFSF